MAIFSYRARDDEGNLLQGKIEAKALEQGVKKLHQLGLYVIDIKSDQFNLSMTETRLTPNDLSIICRQLAFLLKAGLPLLYGLETIFDYQEKKKIKNIVKSIMNEIELGFSFSEACANYPNEIPPIMVNMIIAGESGGFLDQTLESLATYFEKEMQIKTKMISAVSYSGIVFLVAIGFLFFLFGFIVPNFLIVLNNLGVSLSVHTAFLLNLGLSITDNWKETAIILILLYVIVKILNKTTHGKELQDRLILKTPFLNKLVQRIILSRLCREVANLLKSGLPLLNCLEIIEKTNNNSVLQKDIRIACNNLKLGVSLPVSFQGSLVISSMVIQMLAVGERSGNLEELLLKTSEYYDYEINEMTEKIPKMIEPIILLAVGSVIGTIILGIILPMINTMYQIGI